MPIHDWTRVDAGIFHDFHQSWIPEIKRVLNDGRLPADHYALVEQVAGARWPDVLTLQGPAREEPRRGEPAGGLALADAPPQVEFRFKADGDRYAAKASSVVVRHVSEHRVVAVVEIISPGNKSSRSALDDFVRKAVEMLKGGIHLLVVDLFPPGPRDPEGIHRAIWDFVQPVAVGGTLCDMPLFLSPDVYVPVPLEASYQAAWETVPGYWRAVLEAERCA